jgi:hypothetical protein
VADSPQFQGRQALVATFLRRGTASPSFLLRLTLRIRGQDLVPRRNFLHRLFRGGIMNPIRHRPGVLSHLAPIGGPVPHRHLEKSPAPKISDGNFPDCGLFPLNGNMRPSVFRAAPPTHCQRSRSPLPPRMPAPIAELWEESLRCRRPRW